MAVPQLLRRRKRDRTTGDTAYKSTILGMRRWIQVEMR